METILDTAKNCRHYAMCKIDFLETGVCSSGEEKGFVAYYPQGRMMLYAAIASGKIPVTEAAIEIADTCDLCGKCDYQCYFVTGMKPLQVMRELKTVVQDFLDDGGIPVKNPPDEILEELRKITGEDGAESDKAVTVTYSYDPAPLTVPVIPKYVVMPSDEQQLRKVMIFLKERKLEYAVRGNGSSVMGFVMSPDVVIDLGRMKEIFFDERNWKVRAGAGISAFKLQKEAVKRGYRVNVAEPAALVCSNVMCSGIFSTFSASCGTMAENIVDAGFVASDGFVFRMNDRSAPNLAAFSEEGSSSPGICTWVEMKLHRIPENETGILVPFSDLETAHDFARECNFRRAASAIGILGGEYISTFISPNREIAWQTRDVFTENLKIAYLVLLIGDERMVHFVKGKGLNFIDQDLFRSIMLGLSSLQETTWLDLLTGDHANEPFSWLGVKRINEMAETVLSPSPERAAEDTDPELRAFFRNLFSKPEMTDLVWLNTFRIISSRMGREKHVVAWIIYLPAEYRLLQEINEKFRVIASSYGLKNDFGFVTPIHDGKRLIFEYDYFLDQNDDNEKRKMLAAMQETGGMIMSYHEKSVKWIRFVQHQGISRPEYLLYC